MFTCCLVSDWTGNIGKALLLRTNLNGVWLEFIGVKRVTTENVGLSVLVVTEAFIYRLL